MTAKEFCQGIENYKDFSWNHCKISEDFTFVELTKDGLDIALRIQIDAFTEDDHFVKTHGYDVGIENVTLWAMPMSFDYKLSGETPLYEEIYERDSENPIPENIIELLEDNRPDKFEIKFKRICDAVKKRLISGQDQYEIVAELHEKNLSLDEDFLWCVIHFVWDEVKDVIPKSIDDDENFD